MCLVNGRSHQAQIVEVEETLDTVDKNSTTSARIIDKRYWVAESTVNSSF